jgi:hypothetical protein
MLEMDLDYAVLDCNDPQFGDDSSCQIFIAGLHAISPAAFYRLKESFFGEGNNPAEKTMPATFLDVAGASNDFIITTSPDFDNRFDNEDLNIGLSVGSYLSNEGSATTLPIALFKGINRMFAPDTYYFSKAGIDQVVFRAVRDGRTVYRGNVINAHVEAI